MARFGHAASAAVLLVALASSTVGQAQSVQTDYTYDVHGRLTKVTRPDSTTQYTYDNAQNRTNVTTALLAGNRAPIANADTITLNVGASLAFNPLANDSDPDSDAFFMTGVTASAQPKGTLNPVVANCLQAATNCVTYNAGSVPGSDSFTYALSDGKGGTATGTVTVTINATVAVPAAQPINVVLTPNSAGNVVSASLPLSFTGGAPTSVTVPSGPGAGSAVASGTSIAFSSSGWSGQTSLQYAGSNSNGAGPAAPATILVKPVVSAATGLTATPGQAKTVPMAPYALTSGVTSMSLPNGPNTAKGTASFSGTTLTYTPSAGQTGSDTFAYTATSAGGVSAPANITFQINANRNPTPVNDTYTVAYQTPATFSVLANDSDPDGDALTIVGVNPGNKGNVSYTSNSVTYSPLPGTSGSDQFSYVASDGKGGSALGYVNVTINPPPNQPPVLVNDTISIAYQTPTAFFVLNNDSDPENDPLTVTSTSQPSHGYSWPNSDNTVTYGPNNGYSGPDSFTYTVSDGHGNSRTATVNITVRPANNPPVADERWTNINQSTSITLDPRNGDVDPDQDPLTVTGLGGFYFAYGRLNGVDINSSSPQAPSNIGSRSFTGSSMTYNAPFVSNTPGDFFVIVAWYTVSDGKGGTAQGDEVFVVNAR